VIEAEKHGALPREPSLFLRRNPDLAAHDFERDRRSRLLVDRAIDDTGSTAAHLALDAEPSSERAPRHFRCHCSEQE
jgi:hypothetical protein